ncbi:S8 family peptidase [Pseudobacteriovorax antillogorgiicola]|uniref:Subtilase family protein n=1 Tax=Pseudobacteriovorax antillogorgiicola TaxID=1513793 RepID=A0A1Y6CZE8_9BACT|nr:S8 family serine peptidase [Pseudobacteriovorax antillogorgiicola]TCS40525.1 subtilase family protein [Pseudobacteriovorax antillogorgiicola]SMF84636.1 Subtilase family protein [Pseudobacteriovorax antillogorgiicola]
MKRWFALPIFASLSFASCGKDGSTVVSLLCGIGNDSSALTVGFNLAELAGLGLTQNDAVDNTTIKDFLNDSLDSFVTEDVLRVKTVETAKPDDTTDSVRFLTLSGTLAGTFGVASSYFRDALDDSIFEYINDSFNVSSSALRIPKQTPFGPMFGDQHFPQRALAGLTTLQSSGDPHPEQWALEQTDFTAAMNYLSTIQGGASNRSNEVIVAVLDTGVDSEHPDLQDILVDGYDAVGSSTGTDDENGHGTHCAGIIASQVKTAGTSPLGVASRVNVKIMPIKVLDQNGAGGFQAIEKGVRYAMRSSPKPEVLSLSLGAGLDYGDLDDQTKTLVNQLFKDAVDAGIIVIVAAGNEGCPLGGSCRDSNGIFPKTIDEYIVLPCMYQDVVCVGASDPDESLASYSNYSSQEERSYRVNAHINAPGTNIYSTWPTDQTSYKTISGTSMATPYVAGIAAIMKSVYPELTQEQFIAFVQSGQVEPSEMVSKSEVGRLDLYKSLVAFGTDSTIGLNGGTPDGYSEPAVNPVDGPEESSSGSSPVSTLWSAICQ